ncbi:hypothetical protein [Providencia rettgeri]|uniref:hypothetical protein n=1 Tax=Providencia rettgeri TaxID=587 RepID=UPI0023600A47|nr:hypothetical protein [Providencia rettgeri]
MSELIQYQDAASPSSPRLAYHRNDYQIRPPKEAPRVSQRDGAIQIASCSSAEQENTTL